MFNSRYITSRGGCLVGSYPFALDVPHSRVDGHAVAKFRYVAPQVLITQGVDTGTSCDIAFSVDYKKESKEKLIWASYFARFNASTMHVLYYDYRDEGLRYKWYSNMQFMHRFFSNLSLTFAPHVLQRRTNFSDVSALNYAQENEYGLFIAVTTNERDGAEFFIGVQEDRIIVNRHRIPVLFINPRDDIYVLCD